MSDEGLVQFLLEQIDDPRVTSRAMFGGHGIYLGSRMFALVYGDSVYMKVSDQEAKTSDRAPFNPREHQTFSSYREIRADELEDREALATLAQKAQEAAGASRP